jgi:hypothetical protein
MRKTIGIYMGQMYSPTLNWDGICMGKTIALKLSKKDEQIVTQFNAKGMTNSELLRSALRYYVQEICNVSSEDLQMKNAFVKQNNQQIDFSDFVKELRLEMQGIQEQLKRTQKQVESDVQTLQRQVSQLMVSAPIAQDKPASAKHAIYHDIHRQIDEFLYKQTQKNGLEQESCSR